MKPPHVHPALTIALLWLVTATLAARLETAPELHGLPESEIAAHLAGETRQALGRRLYRSSDIYFHRGARSVSGAPFREDAFTKIYYAIAPNVHDHLDEAEAAEVLPWLLATLRTDPQHVEAWRVAAFWLASPAIAGTDQAIALLAEGARLHPHDYRFRLDLARLLLRRGEIEPAVRHLDRGLALWRSDPPRGHPEEAVLEKAELLMYRALCDEIAEDPRTAADRYDSIARIFPDREDIAVRRDALRAGKTPELPALAWIKDLVEHSHPEEHDCDHHHHHQ